mmetsp:Transcript_91161/g.195528  ORF Transcript_91161/g.195528 Transcript_91161/m.195528 type:complete len:582 (+) Transcript_91161:80-1825(+)
MAGIDAVAFSVPLPPGLYQEDPFDFTKTPPPGLLPPPPGLPLPWAMPDVAAITRQDIEARASTAVLGPLPPPLASQLQALTHPGRCLMGSTVDPLQGAPTLEDGNGRLPGVPSLQGPSAAVPPVVVSPAVRLSHEAPPLWSPPPLVTDLRGLMPPSFAVGRAPTGPPALATVPPLCTALPPQAASPARYYFGVVKSYNAVLDIGVVYPLGMEGPDIAVHGSDVIGPRPLCACQRVFFLLLDEGRHLRASAVLVLDEQGRPLAPPRTPGPQRSPALLPSSGNAQGPPPMPLHELEGIAGVAPVPPEARERAVAAAQDFARANAAAALLAKTEQDGGYRSGHGVEEDAGGAQAKAGGDDAPVQCRKNSLGMLKSDSVVRITGFPLEEYNGRMGNICGYDGDKERYEVKLHLDHPGGGCEAEEVQPELVFLRFKEDNLQLIWEDDAITPPLSSEVPWPSLVPQPDGEQEDQEETEEEEEEDEGENIEEEKGGREKPEQDQDAEDLWAPSTRAPSSCRSSLASSCRTSLSWSEGAHSPTSCSPSMLPRLLGAGVRQGLEREEDAVFAYAVADEEQSSPRRMPCRA